MKEAMLQAILWNYKRKKVIWVYAFDMKELNKMPNKRKHLYSRYFSIPDQILNAKKYYYWVRKKLREKGYKVIGYIEDGYLQTQFKRVR